jgi:hypothetical protein
MATLRSTTACYIQTLRNLICGGRPQASQVGDCRKRCVGRTPPKSPRTFLISQRSPQSTLNQRSSRQLPRRTIFMTKL